LVAGAGAMALYLGRSYASVAPTVAASGRPGPAGVEWPVAPPVTGAVWGVMAPYSGESPAAGKLASRFRLAGTFFSYGVSQEPRRKAVIDTLAERRQSVVGEGETLGSVRVVRVFYDHVILREGDLEESLWLRFAGGEKGPAAPTMAEAGGKPPLELNRFGKKVEADRWIFSRDKLLAYYQDLLDEPARLAKVFDSLKPLYDENRRITGYVLGVEGEGDFFKAVGLREGDIVRSVNSLEMTSRRRAEYFIREFVGNRLNIFVLDVQRKEGPQKLIYEVR
jgi:type II secretory pathway component PulC